MSRAQAMYIGETCATYIRRRVRRGKSPPAQRATFEREVGGWKEQETRFLTTIHLNNLRKSSGQRGETVKSFMFQLDDHCPPEACRQLAPYPFSHPPFTLEHAVATFADEAETTL